MTVVVKVKACAECLRATISEQDGSHPVSPTNPGTSEGLQLWKDYEFTPMECSFVDFLNETKCGICQGSLTNDRRQGHDDEVLEERRVSMIADRRTPLGRGSRILMASLRV